MSIVLINLDRLVRPMAARVAFACLISAILYSVAIAQSSQNPSPMVEHVREHPRLEKVTCEGHRAKLVLGELFVPAEFKSPKNNDQATVVLAFHCGNWIPELACAKLEHPLPCVSFQLGSGSGRYAKPFQDDPALVHQIIEGVEKELKVKINKLVLVGWSAGYGAIAELLKVQQLPASIDSVLLIDGLHASYVDGKPGPQESNIVADSLQPFLQFARQAVVGEKRFIILHSEIFPGTFASTTETADWLIGQLGIKRTAVLRWGPMKTQQLGETTQGQLQIRAFAGNSAPDHVDLLHGLPEFLAELLRM